MKITRPRRPNARTKMPRRTQVREEEEEDCVGVSRGAAGVARGVVVGVVEGMRVDEDEIIVGVDVATWVELLVGIAVEAIVLVGWVEVVDIENVLEVVGAGVAKVVAMTNAVGVSEVSGGIMLVAGFGLWTSRTELPWSLR
jgi:hypothetical protein